MLKTKREVDAHVRDIFSKVKNEEQRIQKCLNIAKAYAAIKEFETAKRHLETFLGANPTSGEGLKLQGDIHWELGEDERAVQAYKKAYTLTPSREILNRVCDLIVRGASDDNIEGKKHWFDLQKEEGGGDMMGTPNGYASNGRSVGSEGRSFLNNLASRRVNMPTTPTGPSSGSGGLGVGVGNGFAMLHNFQPTLNRNGNGTSPKIMKTPKQRGMGMGTSGIQTSPERMMMQMSLLDKKYDDVVERIMEQNAQVLSTMNNIRDALTGEIQGLNEKVSGFTTEVKTLNTKVEKMSGIAAEVKTLNTKVEKMSGIAAEVTSVNSKLDAASGEIKALTKKCDNLQKKFEDMVDGVGALSKHQGQSQPQVQPVSATVPAPAPAAIIPTLNPNPPPLRVPDKPLFVSPATITPVPIQHKSNPNPVIPVATTKPIMTGIASAPTTFSFAFAPQALGTTSSSLPLVPAPTKPTITSDASKPSGSIFPTFSLMSSASGVGFGDLASSANNIFAKPAGLGFQGFGGQPLFGSLNPNNNANANVNANVNNNPNPPVVNQNQDAGVNRERRVSEGENPEDYEPAVEFTPVIPLPPLVEAKLGDENENVIFEHRAKIYRYDSSVKEWKERGLGNIKILQDKDNSRSVRIVMWREKVGKLACNHRITGDMTMDFNQGNLKVVRWSAVDHSEEEAKPELFTCKFGQEEKCAEFKQKFEEMVNMVKEVGSNNSTPDSSFAEGDSPQKEDNRDGAKANDTMPLSELFKKPEGSWDCAACYVTNKGDVVNCACCGTLKPGATQSTSITAGTVSSVPALTSAPTFTFGFPAPTAPPKSTSSSPAMPSSEPSTAVTSDSDANKSIGSIFPNFSLFSGGSAKGFGDLAASPNSTFGKPEGFKGFGGVGQPVFGSLNNNANQDGGAGPSRERRGSEGGENPEDYEPGVEFTPVIPLPPLVEVKLGDENENVIFEHRAKVYRYDSSVKEWKERGLGNIKILQDKDNSRAVRIVMWREKVGKLACNHRITGDMMMDFYQGNLKVVRWSAVDHSEEEAKPELFTCKFGQEEKCVEFKQKFEEMVKLVKEAGSSNSTPDSSFAETESPQKEDNKKTPSQGAADARPLSELFKKPEGSWDCGACYVTNKGDVVNCACCGTLKPGATATQSSSITAGTVSSAAPLPLTSAPTFTFGFPAPTAPANSTSSSSETSKVTSSDSDASKSIGSIFPNFSLFANGPAPGFGDLAASPNSTFGKPEGFKGFGGIGQPVFSSLTNQEAAAGGPSRERRGSEGENPEEYEPGVEFTPVIPLPPLVEVKLGDENENVIFEHRAKIYRYDSSVKEWKERGLGNIKILQDKDNSRAVRVVMWREKIGKLACNHRITGDMMMDFYQGNLKVVRWSAVDHSEEEPKPELFTCRFGQEEKCAEFKQKFEEMVKVVGGGSGQSPSTSISTPPTTAAPKTTNENKTSPPTSSVDNRGGCPREWVDFDKARFA